jgi:DNA-directed RNA polymerase subunit RPC12/RpoP
MGEVPRLVALSCPGCGAALADPVEGLLRCSACGVRSIVVEGRHQAVRVVRARAEFDDAEATADRLGASTLGPTTSTRRSGHRAFLARHGRMSLAGARHRAPERRSGWFGVPLDEARRRRPRAPPRPVGRGEYGRRGAARWCGLRSHTSRSRVEQGGLRPIRPRVGRQLVGRRGPRGPRPVRRGRGARAGAADVVAVSMGEGEAVGGGTPVAVDLLSGGYPPRRAAGAAPEAVGDRHGLGCGRADSVLRHRDPGPPGPGARDHPVGVERVCTCPRSTTTPPTRSTITATERRGRVSDRLPQPTLAAAPAPCDRGA